MLTSTVAKIVLTGALALGGGGFLVYSSLDDAQYYEMVDKVAAKPDAYMHKDLKLHGFVEPGTLREERIDGKTVRFFVLEMNGERVPVQYTGPKPDNLNDRSEVVAQGRLARNGDQLAFTASELMAKCPSKYEGAASNKDLF